MDMIKSTLTSMLIAVLISVSAQAAVELYPLFCDNAVLQRELSLPVFGTADEDGAVTVTLGRKSLKTRAENGRWKVRFPAMKAGGPYTLTVTGKNTLKVQNILIGDVWICTGQSLQ